MYCTILCAKKLSGSHFFASWQLTSYNKGQEKKTGAKVFHNNSKTNHSNLWFLVDISVQFLYLGVFGTWENWYHLSITKEALKAGIIQQVFLSLTRRRHLFFVQLKRQIEKFFFGPYKLLILPFGKQLTIQPIKDSQKSTKNQRFFLLFFLGFYEFFQIFDFTLETLFQWRLFLKMGVNLAILCSFSPKNSS